MTTRGITDFLSYFMTAMSNCALYSESHPAVLDLSGRAVSVLDGLYANDMLSIAVLGGSLIINDVPAEDTSAHTLKFLKHMRRKGIEKMIIRKGVEPLEMKSFIGEFSFSEKITGSYEHIATGIVKVMSETGSTDIGRLIDKNISQVREVYEGISKHQKLDMVGLEDVVINFISLLKKESDILNVISPVKSYSEYTYAHTTNVALLSIFQAEALGLRGNILYDIGLAGLLHDVGKLFIPQGILEKKGHLDEEEWAEMKNHPVHSALYLSRLPDVPKLAVIASYEHHMKFNGSGYPETKKRGKNQHAISQIIAVSDFFDAMRTERPYRRALDSQIILGLMKKTSGTEFNPLFVDNFCLAIEKNCIIKSQKS